LADDGSLLPPAWLQRRRKCHALYGVLLSGALTLAVTRFALWRCDAELRDWYDRNVGSKVLT